VQKHKILEKQPFLIYFISIILGIFFQEYFALSEKWVLYILGFSFLTAIFFLSKNFFIQKIRIVFLSFVFFSAGIFLHFYNSKKPSLPEFNKNEKLIFTIDKKLNSTVKNRRYIAKLFTEKGNFRSVLSVPKNISEFRFDRAYRADLWISIPEKPDNDFQFDYQKYLARQHIYFQAYLPGSYEIAERKQLDFLERIKQNRFLLLQKIENSGISLQSKNFLKGIILADRSEMDEITVQDFNRSGLTHFLAISGTHIAIIYWMIMYGLQFLIPVKFRKFSILISLILIWMFAFYIGFGSSVMRSCIMITLYYTYVLLQRKPDLLHSLSFAGILILFSDSQQLYDIGFQLSFLAVFGIFWLNHPILNLFRQPKNKLEKIAFNTVSISFAAQLATLPLVLFYFHQFSWMAVPANLVIIPFSEIIIIFSFLMTVFFGFGIDFTFINIVFDAIVRFLLWIIHWFADQDHAFKKMIPMNIFEVILCFAIVYSLRFVIINFKIKNIAISSVLIFSFFIIRNVLDNIGKYGNEIMETHYFKNTVFINKKGEKAVFYISGKSDSSKIIKNIIEPYLTSRRIKNYEMIRR